MRIGAVLGAVGLALAGCTASQPGAPALTAAPAAAAVETIAAADLAALIAAGKVVLIDVRTPWEFADARIAGSLNAPLTHFDPAAIPLEAERETILYCGSSRRSAIAAEQLAAYTGQRVRHLEGGIAAWREAGLPVIANDRSDDPRQP